MRTRLTVPQCSGDRYLNKDANEEESDRLTGLDLDVHSARQLGRSAPGQNSASGVFNYDRSTAAKTLTKAKWASEGLH